MQGKNGRDMSAGDGGSGVTTKFDTQLIDKIRRTSDAISFRFERPEDFTFRAGQFFFVKIPAEGGSMQKHFSFSSSPTEQHLEFTTKMTGSDFKNALDRLEIGTTVMIEGPYGEFTLKEGMNKIAFLSGGIGITPIRSIARYVTDEGLDVDIVLLFGNQDLSSIAFKDDLEEMGLRNGHLKVVHVLSNPPGDWTGAKGFITRDVVESEVEDHGSRAFYICGPPGMVKAMKTILIEMEVPRDRIFIENFVGYQ